MGDCADQPHVAEQALALHRAGVTPGDLPQPSLWCSAPHSQPRELLWACTSQSPLLFSGPLRCSESTEVVKCPCFAVAPLRAPPLGTRGPWGSLHFISEGSLLLSHSSRAHFLFLSMLKLHPYHRARWAFRLPAQQAICCASSSSVRAPSPVNQCCLHRAGRKKPHLLYSVSFPNHFKPLALKAVQLHPYKTHPALLFLVICSRLIFYAAFKVPRRYIGGRDVLALRWALWEIFEDSEHLISPVTLPKFMCHCNEDEREARNGHQRRIALPRALGEDDLCILALCFE